MILKLLLAILLIADRIISPTTIRTSTKRIRKTLPAPNRTALLEDYEVSNEEYALNKNIIKNIKNAYDRNKIRGYRGWTHAPEKIKEWDKWLDDYYEDKNSKTNIDYVDPDNIHEFDWERGPNSGFPPDWAVLRLTYRFRAFCWHCADVGKGQQGVAPPPWAYEPVSYAKPRCCYLSLDRGEVCENNSTAANTTAINATNTNSTTVHERYAYNPILNKCEEFHYEGCKGNTNNFKDKIKCEATCINRTTSTGGCDRNSHIRIEIKEYK